jgi:hypothetical protein
MSLTEPPDDMPALLRAAAALPGPAGADCLDEKTIAAVVDGVIDDDARQTAVRHLASCARCRGAVASVVRGLANRAVASEIASIEVGRQRRFVRYALPAIAAAAVVVLLAQPRSTTDDSSRHRAPAITSAAPVPLSPVAAVAEARVLRWSAVPGADRYRVTIFDAHGKPVYESQLADTLATLPDTMRLVAGQVYLWSVDARIGWDRWASSPLTEFSVVAVPRR